MIKIYKGDIWMSDRKNIVVPVNMVGVMGAGLAKQCKSKYPNAFIFYKSMCGSTKDTGRWPIMFKTLDDKNILLFPTKRHWKDQSSLSLIIEMLDNFVEDAGQEINKAHRYSEGGFAFPALGCGCGGLNWKDVEPIMVEKLMPISTEIKIEIWSKQ